MLWGAMKWSSSNLVKTMLPTTRFCSLITRLLDLFALIQVPSFAYLGNYWPLPAFVLHRSFAFCVSPLMPSWFIRCLSYSFVIDHCIILFFLLSWRDVPCERIWYFPAYLIFWIFCCFEQFDVIYLFHVVAVLLLVLSIVGPLSIYILRGFFCFLCYSFDIPLVLLRVRNSFAFNLLYHPLIFFLK